MTTNEGRCEPHEILALLRYEPETGCFFWKFREGARASDNTRRAGKAAGWRDEKGYVRIEIYKRTYKAHRLAWAYMTGSWPDGEIDHINGIPNDNRWVNLREDVPEVWSNRAWLAASRNAEKLGIRMHGGEMGNLIDAALAAVAPLIAKAERERCIAAGQKAWPKAHTYASENADMYRAQDHAAATVLAAIRALGGADE